MVDRLDACESLKPVRPALLLLAAYGSPAVAHGFGQRFDLPLPLWLWEAGAAATILLSFAVLAWFVRAAASRADYPRLELAHSPVARWFGWPVLMTVVRIAAATLFVVTIVAGLFGTSDPFRNLAPTMVWVIWWVGFAFACALVGDLWALVNPLSSLFAWVEAGYARMVGTRLSLDLPYPPACGAWPATLAFLGFTWAELVWHLGDLPFKLALMIVAYALATWVGMMIYGRNAWLPNGEAFTVAFAVLARFAPLDTRHWRLRPPAAGLLDNDPIRFSDMVFVLTMLATVTFDGLLETALWQDATGRLSSSPLAAPVLALAHLLDLGDAELLNTAGLVAAPALFVAIYLAFCALMARLTASSALPMLARWDRTALLARSFVLTLVPIAIAYHLAHYLSMLLTSGQFIIPLASDPLGRGWNLFGTAGFTPDLTLVGARFVWYSAATAVVLGHVASVYLAHVVALDVFRDRRAALVSQIPMVGLMILYTMTSLWILAQPIVG